MDFMDAFLAAVEEEVRCGDGITLWEAPSSSPYGYTDLSAGQNLFQWLNSAGEIEGYVFYLTDGSHILSAQLKSDEAPESAVKGAFAQFRDFRNR